MDYADYESMFLGGKDTKIFYNVNKSQNSEKN